MSMPPKPPGYYTDKLFTCDDMDKAIQKEREECAKLCDAMDSISDYYTLRVELVCAQAIRARGQNAKKNL